jgi:hypothetical protein
MAGKSNNKSSEKFIKQQVQAKKIQLVNENKLNMFLIRRHLGIEPDDKDPKTFTGNEDFIKDLQKKLAKAKAERNRLGK